MNKELEIDFEVSQFFDLLDAKTLTIISDAVFATTMIVLENK